MTKEKLGTKRIDPETGRKFYDLNRDPIISPYTGLSYPRSYFEATAAEAKSEEDELETEELDAALDKPDFISLDDVNDDAKDDDLPDLDDDVPLDDDDTFLPDDDDDDDSDVSDLLGGNNVTNDDDL